MPQVDLVMMYPQIYWLLFFFFIFFFRTYEEEFRILHYIWQLRIKKQIKFWLFIYHYMQKKKKTQNFISFVLNNYGKNWYLLVRASIYYFLNLSFYLLIDLGKSVFFKKSLNEMSNFIVFVF